MENVMKEAEKEKDKIDNPWVGQDNKEVPAEEATNL